MVKSAAQIFLLAVLVSQVSGVAHLFIVNGISNFKANSDLDIFINSSRVISRFRYGQGAGYLQLPSGPVTVQARLTTSPRPPYGFRELLLHDDRHYVLVACGSLTNSSQYVLELSGGPFAGGSNSSMATLAFFHVAPGSDSLSLSVDNNLAQLAEGYPFGSTMSQPQFTPTTHVLVLRDAVTSQLMLKTRAKLQAGLNFFFALGDVVGGQQLSLRAVQPSVIF